MAPSAGIYDTYISLGAGIAGAVLLLLLYVAKVNRAMCKPDPEAIKYTPKRWSADEYKAVYKRMEKQPIDWTAHLPPKLERRYMVVGGSGLVGGNLVLLLLAQGHKPEAIRIVDFRAPFRTVFRDPGHKASRVPFFQADVTSESSTKAAFFAAWDPSVASLPLTVLHTAAVIRPSERSPLVYDRCARVNVGGLAVSLSTARQAGADVFIVTSSCSVALRPVKWWMAPWRTSPEGYTQVLRQEDFDVPLRERDKFASNYARSKAEGERLVCAANELPDDPLQRGGFRTGAVRPGSAIYGDKDDIMVGPTLRSGSFPTFCAPWVQNWIHANNAALAHLLYEAALLSEHARMVAGRTYLVTDGGPPVMWQDFYNLAQAISITELVVHYPPPVLLLLLAHALELYCLVIWRLPFLRELGITEPGDPIYMLQPAVIDASTNTILDDTEARRPVEQGGLGYSPACGTVEGVCMQMVEWNRFAAQERAQASKSGKQADVVRSSRSPAQDLLDGAVVDPAARKA